MCGAKKEGVFFPSFRVKEGRRKRAGERGRDFFADIKLG